MLEQAVDFEELLGNLPEADNRRFHDHLAVRTYKPRERLFSAGEESGDFLIIRSGRVRTYFVSTSGQEVTTGIWAAGYVIGLLSSLSGMPRFLSSEAIDTATAGTMTTSQLRRLMGEMPDLGFEVSRLLAKIASLSISRAGVFATSSVNVRLVETLLSLGRLPEAATGSDSATIRGLSHEDIARMVNASRPWIAQAISRLESRGLITSSRMMIEIPSLSALSRLTDDSLS